MKIILDLCGAQYRPELRSYALNLAEQLSRATKATNHSLVIVVCENLEHFEQLVDPLKLKIVTPNIRAFKNLRPEITDDDSTASNLIRLNIHAAFLQELEPDLIISTDLAGFCSSRDIRKVITNIPVITILDDHHPFPNREKDLPVFEPGTKWFYKRFQYVEKGKCPIQAVDIFGRDNAFEQDAFEEITDLAQDYLRDISTIDYTNVEGLLENAHHVYYSSGSYESYLKGVAEIVTIVPEKSLRPALSLDDTGIYKKRDFRILAIKMDHLGDFLLAIPAFSKLKARYPYSSIDVICGSWNKAIAEQTGIFNQVFSYDFFKKKSSDPSELDYHKLSAFLNELPSYDIAVDLRRYKDARFLITKVNAKLKVAVETGDPDIDAKIHVKVPTWPEYTYKANPLNERPIGDHMVSIIDAIPNLPTDFITFPDILKGRPAKKTRSIGIFPKAGERAREWGEKNYSQLIGLLCHDDHIDEVSVYLANDKEKKLLHLPTSPKVVVRAGLPLPKLIEALCENSLCVGNNSGGGHLASYLGIPTLAIYSGHESLDEWGPAYNEVYVLHRTPYCSPCHVGENCTNGFFCLQDITPGDAHASIRSILGFDDELKTGKERRRKYLYAKSKDRIVRTLFRQIITKTKDYNPSKLASLASIISNNHPGFPSSQDTVFAASNLSMNHLSPLLEFEGFYMPEIEFRWSEGNQSHIRFYRREKSSFNRVKIDFAHILAGIQEVKVKFNGREVLNSIVDDSCKFLKFCVDEMLAGVNNITLDLPTARVPDNGDSRKLAVAFKSMEISEQSTLRVGKIEDYRSEVIDFHGFHEPEDGFRWTSGREAKIQFLSEKSLEKCTIKIGVFHVIDDRQTINVSFNENALGEFVLNKQMKTFELAGIEIKKGKNTVSLSLPQAREASTDDRRIIAIALSDIRLLYTN